MLDWIAIIAGLVLLWAILVARQLASIRLPELRWVPTPSARAPAAYADLYEQADADLRALGFAPRGWVCATDIGTGTRTPMHAYAHAHACAVALVQQPVDPARADRLVVSIGQMLADGCSLSSFRTSLIDELFDTPRHRRRSFDVDDISTLWQAHQQWRQEFAIADADDAIGTLDDIVAGMSRRFGTFIDALLAARTLRRASDGSLRLRTGTMWRLLRALRRARKGRAAVAPLEPARERALLPLVERMCERAPTRGTQWLLLAATTLLFTLLGGLLWGWTYSALIAGALLLHEGGHWLAMRVLGYRNVQVVLLPLIGGITTGVERDPRGSHRAIVSLMGPLPGIVLGWALLAFAMRGGHTGLLPAASVLLALNYLNLLPLPPLDGGHFVQSLLPRGWVWLEVLLLVAFMLATVVLIVFTQWWLLLVLVAMQATALGINFSNARLVENIRAEGDPLTLARHELDDRIVAAVVRDRPRAPPLQRLQRALRLRTLLLLRPPRVMTRVALLLVYLAAFAVPPLASPALRDTAQLWLASRGTHVTAAVNARADRYLRRLREQERASAALDDAHLLAGIEAAADAQRVIDESAQPPAVTTIPDEAAFAAAQARLGSPLPAGYRELARAPQRYLLELRAPDHLVRAGDELSDWLDQWTEHGQHEVPVFATAANSDDEPSVLTRARLAQALVIGGNAEFGLLLHDAEGDACCRIIEFSDEDASGYRDLHAWLVAQHVQRTLMAEDMRELQARRASALAATATLDVDALVSALGASAHAPEWRQVDTSPRSSDSIEAAVAGLGDLPDDYRALLALRNGVPAAGLLPLERIERADAAAIAQVIGTAPITRIDDDGNPQGTFNASDVASPAIVIGTWQPYRGEADVLARASLLLVRFADAPPRYLDIGRHRAYASLRALLREQLAWRRASLWDFDGTAEQERRQVRPE